MDSREVAILCTHVVTAMKNQDPNVLDSVIADLEATPWHPELAAVCGTVRNEITRQKHAKRDKKSK